MQTFFTCTLVTSNKPVAQKLNNQLQMGAALSVDAQVNNVINDTVNEVFVEFGQECKADVSQQFQLLAKNKSKINIGSLDQTQSALAVLECAQDTDAQAALATKLTNDLKKKFEQDGSSAMLSAAASLQLSNVQNTIKNRFSAIDKQACMSAVTQLVKIEATDESEINIQSVVSRQVAEAAGECAKISTLAVDVSNDISNRIASETRLSGPIIAIIAVVALAIVAGLIGIIVKATQMRKKKRAEQEQLREMQTLIGNNPALYGQRAQYNQRQPSFYQPEQQQRSLYPEVEQYPEQQRQFTQPAAESRQQPFALSPSPYYG